MSSRPVGQSGLGDPREGNMALTFKKYLYPIVAVGAFVFLLAAMTQGA